MKLSQQIDVTREYTTGEAAALLSVDPSYLRRLLGLLNQPILKGRNIQGRVWLIDGASLKKWQELRERRKADK